MIDAITNYARRLLRGETVEVREVVADAYVAMTDRDGEALIFREGCAYDIAAFLAGYDRGELRPVLTSDRLQRAIGRTEAIRGMR